METMNTVISFDEALRERGFIIGAYDDGLGEAHNDTFRIRWDDYEQLVDAGVKETFCKWANSTDYRLTAVPHSPQGVEALLAILEEERAAGRYYPAWSRTKDITDIWTARCDEGGK